MPKSFFALILALWAVFSFATVPQRALADSLVIAVYHTSLARPGPGLLLRDILDGKDPQVRAVTQVIAQAAPDILLLLDIDYDHDLIAINALRDKLEEAGVAYPHVFALPPNTGRGTGLDLDGDGRLGGPRDAQGYGQFSGQGGMAILARYPVDKDAVQDHSAFLWRDLPGALLMRPDNEPVLAPEVLAVQRLSHTAHWVVPITVRDHQIWLLAFHATPPVFDGAEGRNRRRNHDEVRFWTLFLDGLTGPPPSSRFVIIGGSNMDVADSDGLPQAMRDLLSDQRLSDPRPRGGGWQDPTPGQKGDPALDTARWPPPGPGNLRAEYILPSADLTVTDAQVYWPEKTDQVAGAVMQASRHNLVSITVEWP